MPRRVFLDVGGHTGESVRAALDRRWGFDRIWSFEPAHACVEILERFEDDRLTVVPAGWWSAGTEMVVHDPGSIGASIDARKSKNSETEICRFIDCAQWMSENIGPDDLVWLKLNVEGAEIEVLDHLLTSGEIGKVNHLVVHFDVEKLGEFDKAAAMRRRLDLSGVSWHDAKRVMFGPTSTYKVNTWVARTHGLHLRLTGQKLTYGVRSRAYLGRKWLCQRTEHWRSPASLPTE